MNTLEYCERWFGGNRSPAKPHTEVQASERHSARHEKLHAYTVAVDGFERPTAMIEVFNTAIAVTFFDVLLRRVLDYEFHELEQGQLALVMAVRRTYCEATNEMVERLCVGRADPKHPWGQFLAAIDRVLDGRSIIFKPDASTVRRAGRHGDARIL